MGLELPTDFVEEIEERKRNHNQSLLYVFGRGYVLIYHFMKLIAAFVLAEHAVRSELAE